MAQFARPISDADTGSWSGPPHWDAMDEESADDDTTFARSDADPSASSIEVNLSSLTDPVSDANHILRYRHRKGESGGGQPGTIDSIYRLRISTTTIASTSANNVATTWTSGSYTLSAGEADAITDYTALKVQIEANKSAGARTSYLDVTWVEFEVPDVTAAPIPDIHMAPINQAV